MNTDLEDRLRTHLRCSDDLDVAGITLGGAPTAIVWTGTEAVVFGSDDAAIGGVAYTPA